MHQLNTRRREEAIATFAYERITREVFVLFQRADGTSYVIGLNEASDVPEKSDPSEPIKSMRQ